MDKTFKIPARFQVLNPSPVCGLKRTFELDWVSVCWVNEKGGSEEQGEIKRAAKGAQMMQGSGKGVERTGRGGRNKFSNGASEDDNGIPAANRYSNLYGIYVDFYAFLLCFSREFLQLIQK